MSIELPASLLGIKALEESDVADRLSFLPMFPKPCMVKKENGSRGTIAGEVSMSTDIIGTWPGIGESDFRVW